jgi:hypothetical protein
LARRRKEWLVLDADGRSLLLAVVVVATTTGLGAGSART